MTTMSELPKRKSDIRMKSWISISVNLNCWSWAALSNLLISKLAYIWQGSFRSIVVYLGIDFQVKMGTSCLPHKISRNAFDNHLTITIVSPT